MSEVKGQSGQIQFDGQYITITRKGFLARTTVGKGEKRLHISQVSAVQWKPAGPFMNGFIQFTVPGGNERRSAFGSQTTSAAQDENSVVFTKKQQPEFEKLRAALDAAIAAQHAPQAPAAAAPSSLADELGKLAALRQQGILSEAEFEQQKARLLAQ
ncbi:MULTISPECIES: DUF4429 domain-containing protein [unclassified Streptomyces]|uniref:DUF4429 domain-containing protein n=1 Tax=unclassified Streptomyces TaxID=2593676 RepID=UPI00190BE81B|nr:MULTISPECIES: DUF4429 domain-containing protein [unclassified Streptomyces]MBK3563211.1 DUF4429 domain-containing protein [Streptomyces sp. MBT62]MBK6013200.1 DUF4429 domain-containing protein [Streptomyces sp. MBT53]